MQGVWYSGSLQNKARELNLTGFVKNEQDGSVYAEVEGEETIIYQLIDWCKVGPELAAVKNVEVHEGEIVQYKSFNILR